MSWCRVCHEYEDERMKKKRRRKKKIKKKKRKREDGVDGATVNGIERKKIYILSFFMAQAKT